MTRVLVVDDDAALQMQMEEMLLFLNYEVVGVADSGEKAIEMARISTPDLILMDILMPGGMDGITAAQKIKENSDVAIIFVTGFGESEYIDRAKTLEPFGYIMKPFSEQEIQAAIEIALYKQEIERKLKKTNELLKEANQNLVQEILKREQAEAEKNDVIRKLEETIEKFNTLKGLLPICAACKKVRNPEGRWQSIEKFISERSSADFTHDICPECARKLYPDVDISGIS